MSTSPERINEWIGLDRHQIAALFAQFDPRQKIVRVSPLQKGMTNSGYVVETEKRSYFLKLYHGATGQCEAAMYQKLGSVIDIPRLYFFGGSEQSFSVLELVAGETLSESILRTNRYPLEWLYRIGSMCAAIHSFEYPYASLLDAALNSKTPLPPVQDRILSCLEGMAGRYLHADTRSRLIRYIRDHKSEFDQINAKSVLLHGDVNYGNILLVDSKIYFIDFEFAFAGSPYHDIGHFFRRKDQAIQQKINEQSFLAFEKGYASTAGQPLPSNWKKLSSLCDTGAMLGLINRERVPASWIEDIEKDILTAIAT